MLQSQEPAKPQTPLQPGEVFEKKQMIEDVRDNDIYDSLFDALQQEQQTDQQQIDQQQAAQQENLSSEKPAEPSTDSDASVRPLAEQAEALYALVEDERLWAEADDS